MWFSTKTFNWLVRADTVTMNGCGWWVIYLSAARVGTQLNRVHAANIEGHSVCLLIAGVQRNALKREEVRELMESG